MVTSMTTTEPAGGAMGQHCWYAHTVEGRPEEDWQELAAHLTATSDLAAGFAAPFASTEWGRLAGLWHDVGKYRAEFQARLRGAAQDVDHGVVGVSSLPLPRLKGACLDTTGGSV